MNAGQLEYAITRAAQLEREREALAERLKQINDLIFGVGAPMGSDTYFKIRELAVGSQKTVAEPTVIPQSDHHPGCWKLQSPSGDGACNCGFLVGNRFIGSGGE